MGRFFLLSFQSGYGRFSKYLSEGCFTVYHLSEWTEGSHIGDEHFRHLLSIMLKLEFFLFLNFLQHWFLFFLVCAMQLISKIIKSNPISLIFNRRYSLLLLGVYFFLNLILKLLLEGIILLIKLYIKVFDVDQFGSKSKGPWFPHTTQFIIFRFVSMTWWRINWFQRLKNPIEYYRSDCILSQGFEISCIYMC